MSEVKVFYAALKDYSVDEKSGGTVSGVCKVVRLADHEAIALALRRKDLEIKMLREQRNEREKAICDEMNTLDDFYENIEKLYSEILTALKEAGHE